MRKLYHASFAHKITVFKEQNQQIMNFTQKQKHNEYLLQINVTFAVASQRQFQKYVASPWQVPLSYHFRNKICSFFFVFMSTIVEKDCSQRYVVTNGMSISRAFLAIRGYAAIW